MASERGHIRSPASRHRADRPIEGSDVKLETNSRTVDVGLLYCGKMCVRDQRSRQISVCVHAGISDGDIAYMRDSEAECVVGLAESCGQAKRRQGSAGHGNSWLLNLLPFVWDPLCWLVLRVLTILGLPDKSGM
ncbi:hypothetical protein EJB05_16146, partial [Eragrostis curvula]